MEIIVGTLELLGEEHQRERGKNRLEMGAVLGNFILSVVSIVVIVGVALYLARI